MADVGSRRTVLYVTSQLPMAIVMIAFHGTEIICVTAIPPTVKRLVRGPLSRSSGKLAYFLH